MIKQILVLLSAVVICSCTSNTQENFIDPADVLTDVLKLEHIIGGDQDPAELDDDRFLLVRLRSAGFGVNEKNDVLLLDENYVKVFDKNGRPKTIFGGSGQGPGEFPVRAYNMWVGPTGFVSVYAVNYNQTAINFSPDFEYINKISFQENEEIKTIIGKYNIFDDRQKEIYPINDTDMLIIIEADDRKDRSNITCYKSFIYKKGNKYSEIFTSENPGRVSAESISMTNRDLGNIYVNPLDSKKVLIVNSLEDIHVENNKYSYVLTVMDIESNKKKTISHRYLPIVFEDYEPKRSQTVHPDPETEKRLNDSYWEASKISSERMKKMKYKAPIINILTDNNYIFVFNQNTNEKEEILTDVFDADTEKFLNSTYFSFMPAAIKNGFAYKYNWSSRNGFPSVEKFKIDPAVYGK
ncbi:hypothetical protein ACFL7D_06805 [candidate division KSB1 bacterium]